MIVPGPARNPQQSRNDLRFSIVEFLSTAKLGPASDVGAVWADIKGDEAGDNVNGETTNSAALAAASPFLYVIPMVLCSTTHSVFPYRYLEILRV